jgi:hypothetical protein
MIGPNTVGRNVTKHAMARSMISGRYGYAGFANKLTKQTTRSCSAVSIVTLETYFSALCRVALFACSLFTRFDCVLCQRELLGFLHTQWHLLHFFCGASLAFQLLRLGCCVPERCVELHSLHVLSLLALTVYSVSENSLASFIPNSTYCTSIVVSPWRSNYCDLGAAFHFVRGSCHCSTCRYHCVVS